MSIHSIHQYLSEVENIIHFGGNKNETSIRNAFYNFMSSRLFPSDLLNNGIYGMSLNVGDLRGTT